MSFFLNLIFQNIYMSLAVFFVFYIFNKFIKWYKFATQISVPKERLWPFLGHLPYFVKLGTSLRESFRVGLLHFAKDLEEKEGIGQLIFGYKRIVFLTKAEYVEQVLSSHSHVNKMAVYNIFPWMFGGILTSGGQRWKQKRRLLVPIVNLKIRMDNNLLLFNRKAQGLRDYISQQPDNTIEICDIFAKLNFDIITEYLFGYSFNTVQNGEIPLLKCKNECNDLVVIQVTTPIYSIRKVWQMSKEAKTMTSNVKLMRQLLDELIQNHVSNPEKSNPDSFLSHLIAIYGSANNYEEVRQELATFITAGTDTTTNSLSWLFLKLTEYPEMQSRIQKEIDSNFGDMPPDHNFDIDDIHKLVYLQCFFKETVRCFPPVLMFGRKLSFGQKFGPYWLPTNTNVAIHPLSIHFDPNYYKDPEKFNPDRWLDPETSRDRYHLLAFSAGPRKCIAEKFAYNQIKIFLATVLRKYKVVSLTHYPYKVTDFETMQAPHGPINMKFIERNKRAALNC